MFIGSLRRLISNSRSFASAAENPNAPLKKTALYDQHVELGATMVPFAGYLMPVIYKGESVIQSVLHCRKEAGLFDVSHMGQLRFFGKDRVAFLESLCTADAQQMKPGRTKYTLLTNEQGGVVDDSVFTIFEDHIYMVINAGCFDKDVAHISKHLRRFVDDGGRDVQMRVHSDLSLIALQGPKAAAVLQPLVAGDLSKMKFMTSQATQLGSKANCVVTRCGYTGEDGFEISAGHEQIKQLWKTLLKEKDVVHAAGLGARDSLRLEAGLCLYGNDLNETITPVEADLGFALNKRRRNEGGFLGADTIQKQLANGVKTIRIGLFSEGAPPRAGSVVYNADQVAIGTVSSGSPSPVLNRNIAMAYIDASYAKPATKLLVEVRGRKYNAEVTTLPFVKKGWKD